MLWYLTSHNLCPSTIGTVCSDISRHTTSVLQQSLTYALISHIIQPLSLNHCYCISRHTIFSPTIAIVFSDILHHTTSVLQPSLVYALISHVTQPYFIPSHLHTSMSKLVLVAHPDDGTDVFLCVNLPFWHNQTAPWLSFGYSRNYKMKKECETRLNCASY